MKKSLKSILSLILVLVLALGLVGCGNDTPASEESEKGTVNEITADNSEDTTEDATPDDTVEQITLKLWHIWTNDIDPQRMVMEKAVAEVEKAYPNITFEITANEDEDNKTKLPLALASGEGPDIFYWQGAGNGEQIVNSGNVLDLTPYYEGDADLQSKLPLGALSYTMYDGKIYGYTYSADAAYLYCNTELFKKHGVEIPKTYDQLVTAAEKFSEAGVIPMSVAGADLWPIMFQYGSVALKTAGAEACNAALSGEGSFNTPDFIQAAEQLQELASKGFYSDSILAVGYEEAQNAFANGEAAMFYMGNWAAGGLGPDSEAAVAGKVELQVWPDAGNGHENDRFGGSSNAFWVNSNTEYPDEAAAALAMLTEQMSIIGFKEGTFAPIWSSATEGADNPLLQQMAALLAPAEGYTLWWDTALGTEKGGKLNEYCAALLSGEVTPEQFVAALDALVAQ